MKSGSIRFGEEVTEQVEENDEESFSLAEEKDFIFLDPPYDCVFSDYGNESYKEGFGV